MLTIAMPPRIQPTQASARAISFFSEMPPEPNEYAHGDEERHGHQAEGRDALTIRRQTSVSA